MTFRPALEICTGILTALPEVMLKPAWPRRRRLAARRALPFRGTRTLPAVTSVRVPMQEPKVPRGHRTEMRARPLLLILTVWLCAATPAKKTGVRAAAAGTSIALVVTAAGLPLQ